jgi:carbamoyl-phosphate synthase large subunit
VNILLTGGGAPGVAGIIKCLRNGNKNIRIVCVDINAHAYGRVMADKFYQVPCAEDSDFINAIAEICSNELIDIIIPLVTRELFFFAHNKGLFRERGIGVSVQDENTLKIINDKYLLLRTLKNTGIQTPEFYLCTNAEQFKETCGKLGYPEKPICFKPTLSNGSRGFRIISSHTDEFRLLFEEKPNTTYISYEKAVQILSAQDMPPLVVMEYLPGPEWSVDCLIDNGKSLYCIPRLRNRMNGGISVDTTLVEEESIIDLTKDICRTFNIHGNIGIQFKQDAAGLPQVLEINPRLQGSVVSCAAAGINLPYFGVLLLLGKEVPVVTPKWGVRMCRYWEEVYFDKNGQSFTYPVL